jgi:hypothetical protein
VKPEAQRIAIAEACGFKWFAWWHTETEITIPLTRSVQDGDFKRTTFPPTRFLVPASREPGFGEYACADMSIAIDEECFRHVPDYLSDLNAMHEAERVLRRDQHTDYCNLLHDMATRTENLGRFGYIHTTAAQRAEAFLRTLGKWEDGK